MIYSRLGTRAVLLTVLFALFSYPVYAASTTHFTESFETNDFSAWTNTCEHYGYLSGNTYIWHQDQQIKPDQAYDGTLGVHFPDRWVNKQYHQGQPTFTTNNLWKVPSCLHYQTSSIDLTTTPTTFSFALYDTMYTGGTLQAKYNGQWTCNDFGTGDPLRTECSLAQGYNVFIVNTYYYLLNTQVDRSPGWHVFTFTTDGQGNMEAYMDGQLITTMQTPVNSLSSIGFFGDKANQYLDAISLVQENRPPVLVTPAPVTVKEGELVQVTVVASDPDNDPLTITYEDPVNADGQWQTIVGDAGTYTIGITASDGEASVTTTMTVTVVQNTPPLVTMETPITAKVGVEIQLEPIISDPDGDALEVYYPEPFSAEGTWTTTTEDIGAHTYTLEVTDGDSIVSFEFTVIVEAEEYLLSFDKYEGFLVNGLEAEDETCIRKTQDARLEKTVRACSSLAYKYDKYYDKYAEIQNNRRARYAKFLLAKLSRSYDQLGCDDIMEKYAKTDKTAIQYWDADKLTLPEHSCAVTEKTYGAVTLQEKKRTVFTTAVVTSVAEQPIQRHYFTASTSKRYEFMKIRTADQRLRTTYYPRVDMTKIVDGRSVKWKKGHFELTLTIKDGTLKGSVVEK